MSLQDGKSGDTRSESVDPEDGRRPRPRQVGTSLNNVFDREIGRRWDSWGHTSRWTTWWLGTSRR